MAYTIDEWWLESPRGQRTGWMQASAFSQKMGRVFGGKGWQNRFAQWAGIGKSTVYRWSTGADPIPKAIALLITALYQQQAPRENHSLRVTASWLPLSKGANGRQEEPYHVAPPPPDGGTPPVLQNLDIDSQNTAFSHWGND